MEENEFENMTDVELLEEFLEIEQDKLELINAQKIFESKINDLQEELELLEYMEGEENG